MGNTNFHRRIDCELKISHRLFVNSVCRAVTLIFALYFLVLAAYQAWASGVNRAAVYSFGEIPTEVLLLFAFIVFFLRYLFPNK